MRLSQFSVLILLGCLGCKENPSSDQVVKDSALSFSNNGSPNIIVIVSDDLGYGSLGSYGGSRFKTPNLDYWCDNGMRFTNFYVAAPICSPSRASILTGRSPHEAGVKEVLRPASGVAVKGMDTTLPTFPELLKDQGYNTALIGKWHLGYREEEHPQNRGFDEFKGFLGGAINYLSHEYTIGGHAFSQGFKSWEPKKGKHATKIFTDEAISFIEKQRDQPYMLLLSYANPHRPFLFPGEDNIKQEQPGKRLNTAKRYRRMVALLDQQLGRIQSTISKLQQNTIVVFISDHGANDTLRGNGTLRGGKGNLFEGGIKVPAIVYWPGIIEPTEVTDVTTVYDLYPTLLQLGGVKVQETLKVNGSVFLDNNGAYQAPLANTLLWQHNTVQAVRKGKWKAIFIPSKFLPVLNRYLAESEWKELLPFAEPYDGYIPLLYNLDDDPNEENNLSSVNQKETTDLWNLLAKEGAD